MAATAGDDSKAAESAEELWMFPPFFTLQVVDDTRRKQLEHWKTLIVDYHAARKANVLVIAEFPKFENKAIGRKLSPEGIEAVLNYVIESGHGEWEDASKKRMHVFYKSLQDWAGKVYDFVAERAMIGSVYTVYELLNADEYADAAFHSLDEHTMTRALKVLEGMGKAELMLGSGGDAEGVKFLTATGR